MTSQFKKDLELGQKYETEAQKKIIDKFNVNILNECNNYKYDFRCSNGFKYEVKTDLISNITGNFFIEILSHQQPSGIQTTHAHYYIINDTINFYMIEVAILKQLIDELGNTKKLIYTKDKASLGYIIKKHLIIELSIIL